MKKVFLFLSFITLLFVGINSSFACKCMVGTPEENFNDAGKVYIATVNSISLNNNSKVVNLNVLEQFKGVKDDSEVTTNSSSAACGVYFEAGKTYIIYEDPNTLGTVNSCSGTTAIDYTETNNLTYLAAQQESYFSKEVFEKLEGNTCSIATDGCNNLTIENGKIATTTEKYCMNHTPKYKCIDEEKNDKGYKTKEELLKEQPGCKSATDGVNNFFGKELILATKIGYPKDFVAKWECLDEDKKDHFDMVMCTAQYDPVCGEDGKTYGNSCNASVAEVKVIHDGVCKDTTDTQNNSDKLKKLKEKLSKKYISKIDASIKKYTRKLSKLSIKTQRETNEKILEKIEDKLATISKEKKEIHNILSYLKIKIQMVGEELSTKKSKNLLTCDKDKSGLIQCKK